MNITCRSDHPTIRYAADELERCLNAITAGKVEPDIEIGLMTDLGVKAPNVADPALDDAVHIDMIGAAGVIAGINPRSVLLAVYRYLTELGCRWVRPGADGECLPGLDSLPAVKISETPSYRHRGICIEGAVSVQHVIDMIDWMPKVGFNGYFIQFREAYTFFDRWYSRQGEHITVDQAREFTAQVVAEIKKRDLLYHGVGHGWTCEPFGIGGLGWDRDERELPARITRYLAEVNGERKLWHGVALNTNLCYGNPRVRKIVTDEIVNYSAKHPEIDIMHFWLADGSNNHCECERCRDTRPSDFYVQMLNELDPKLAAKGLPTRIVFLIYVDLLWPPERERIEHPERFILMFAPITRTYSEPFATDVEIPEPPPFVRNKLTFPRSVAENIGFLRAWQRVFPTLADSETADSPLLAKGGAVDSSLLAKGGPVDSPPLAKGGIEGGSGDSFDFDYHMMWDHFRDPGYVPVAKILAQDIAGLRDLGLNGYVSCQLQRAFFPTGLPMTVMGRALWNREIGYDEVADDYFAAAFGPDGKLAKEYLESISFLFDPPYLRGETPRVCPENADSLAKVADVVDRFMPTIERNIENPPLPPLCKGGSETPPDPLFVRGGTGAVCRAKSWFYLKHSAQICKLLAAAAEEMARDNADAGRLLWEDTKRYVREHEADLHPVLDVSFFCSTLEGFFA